MTPTLYIFYSPELGPAECNVYADKTFAMSELLEYFEHDTPVTVFEVSPDTPRRDVTDDWREALADKHCAALAWQDLPAWAQETAIADEIYQCAKQDALSGDWRTHEREHYQAAVL